MICTSVVPCLSIGVARNNEIMFMFVLYSRLFWSFESLPFFRNHCEMQGQTLCQSIQTGCFGQFFEGTTIRGVIVLITQNFDPA